MESWSRNAPTGRPRLLTQLRHSLGVRHYSPRTEAAYLSWIKRFVRFHGLRHPAELGDEDVARFLTALAVERRVSASTQSQALAAITYMYREVFGRTPGYLVDSVRARQPIRRRAVLTPEEVEAVLGELQGCSRLMGLLMYGGGL